MSGASTRRNLGAAKRLLAWERKSSLPKTDHVIADTQCHKSHIFQNCLGFSRCSRFRSYRCPRKKVSFLPHEICHPIRSPRHLFFGTFHRASGALSLLLNLYGIIPAQPFPADLFSVRAQTVLRCEEICLEQCKNDPRLTVVFRGLDTLS